MQTDTLKPVVNDIAPGMTSGTYVLPDKNQLRFTEYAERNDRASAMAGAPRYTRVIGAKISVPGNQKSEYSFEAARIFPSELRSEWEKVGRFSDAKEAAELDVDRNVVDRHSGRVLETFKLRRYYEAYRDSTKIAEEGTPIELWSILNPSQVAQFKVQNINTVEQVANISDAFLASLGSGGRGIRDMAQAYLAANTGEVARIQAIVERQDKMEASLSSKDDEIAQLKAALAAATVQRPAPAVVPTPTVEEPPPSPPVRRGGRRSTKPDNVEADVEAEIRAASVGGEDRDFV